MSVSHLVATQVDLLAHRGPDDSGSTWYLDGTDNALLIQTRLSIIDLSSAGHQPMMSSDGRFEIVFNGEIYNYLELREELEKSGIQFTSDTDTEVLLQAWIAWGADGLRRLVGMFAFVVLDREDATLTLVRDAFGIKPLFYRQTETQFSFSSELDSLLALEQTPTSLNWQQCYDYLAHGRYDDGEATFLADVHHVKPAHAITLNLRSRQLGPQKRWWSPRVPTNSTITFDEATQHLRSLLRESIDLHLRSDVPLGTALSGGIDSSAITCIARDLQKNADIRTFSYIATGSPLSEEPWVDLINETVGATAHKVSADPTSLAADLPTLTASQGEPYGSTSIYAQFAVYRETRQSGVVVTLDGQGADELFGGYVGFPGARMLSLLERGRLIELARFARNWGSWPGRTRGYQWQAFAEYFVPTTFRRLALRAVGRSPVPNWMRAEGLSEAGVQCTRPRPVRSRDYRGRRLTEALISSLDRLPALLRHGDRNSMHFSVESRVPFLTVDLAEFSLSLPEDFLVDGDGRTKAVLRESLRGLVPNAVLDRRDKIGFQTPEDGWMQTDGARIDEWLPMLQPLDGLLDLAAIQQDWSDYIAGVRPYAAHFWRLECFARWLSSHGASIDVRMPA